MQKKRNTAKYPVFLIVVLVILIIGMIALRQTVHKSSLDSSSPENSQNPDISPPPPFTGVPFTASGEIVCLPHINQDGPQTMECAYGLKDNEGIYYGLRDSDPEMQHLASVEMNKKITITGTFKEEENTIYPTVGVIEIQSISVTE